MFFADYRARKHAEKQKQEYMAKMYPPGFSNEPKREPNPEYQLQTTEQDIYNYLLTRHMSTIDAQEQAHEVFKSLHWKLYENLDEIIHAKPISNIIIDGRYTFKETLEFMIEDKIYHTMLTLVQYMSLSNRKLLLTPDELNELYLQVQQDD